MEGTLFPSTIFLLLGAVAASRIQLSNSSSVSSSSSPSSSSFSPTHSTTSQSQSCFAPCSQGTPVSLKGTVWMEMENALVLNVDWKGKNFAGTLIKVDDTNSWGPQKLKNYPPLARKRKIYKTWKKFKSFDDSKINSKGPRQKGIYCTKYPRSFVDSSNIVESKLRYGRDKRIAAYRSCPNSPCLNSSGAFSSSFSDLSSITVNSGGFQNNDSFSLEKSLQESLDRPSFTKYPDLNSEKKIVPGKDDQETQCNEVGSTKFGDASVEENDLRSSMTVEFNVVPMPSLSRIDVSLKKTCYPIKNYKTLDLTFKSPSNGDSSMPSLSPVESTSIQKQQLETTCSADSSHNVSITSSSTEILELDSIMANTNQSAFHQTAASQSTASTSSYEELEMSRARILSTDSESEKTYATLENCDISYLNPTYPINNEIPIRTAREAQFFYPSTLMQDETLDNPFLLETQNFVQPQVTDLMNNNLQNIHEMYDEETLNNFGVRQISNMRDEEEN